MRKFQILIVSTVKICKQCLQTASVSEGTSPADFPTGSLPLDPTFVTSSPGLWPQMKISGATPV